MTLAELEDKYGHLIQGEMSFRNTGYGRVLTGELTLEQYNYIISRYEYLVALGDIGKAELARQETMFANLRPEDKAELDAMTLSELTDKYIYVMLPRNSLDIPYILDSKAGRAKKDYIYYRFEDLMAQELIDWRDPQYMEKLNAYVNKTGLDPRTGLEASEDVKLVAQHYGWVKGSSTFVATAIDGVLDYSDLSAYFLTKGKIPSAVYDDIRIRSIHNPDSNEMTLGKYRPTVLPDGTEDWTIPGPDSYIVKAGDTTYFNLGDDWNKITAEYGLDTKGVEMFKYFNVPALDDAVAQGKTIRFSHDPRLKIYENQAIDWEWTYLKEKHGYKRFKQIGDYWYAIK